MKMYSKLFLAALLLISLSCKKKKEVNVNVENIMKEKKEIQYSDDFSITLKVKVDKKDVFQIFYKEDVAEFYRENESLSKSIAPASEFQDFEIILPEDVYPYNFRFDFGINSEQESIQIESLTLKYKKGTYEILGKDIPKYFSLNEGVTMDSDSLTFLLKMHNRETRMVYDPFMIGKPELHDILYLKL